MDSLRGHFDSQRGLWEKLRVPRGKRKAGAARQIGAAGFWARAREARGRKARATEAILKVKMRELRKKEEVGGESGEFKKERSADTSPAEEVVVH